MKNIKMCAVCVISCLTLAGMLCSCARLGLTNTNTNNLTPVEELEQPLSDDIVFNLNEDIIVDQHDYIQVYNLRSIKVFDSLKDAGVDPLDEKTFFVTDSEYEYIIDNGDIKDNFKFVLAEVDVTYRDFKDGYFETQKENPYFMSVDRIDLNGSREVLDGINEYCTSLLDEDGETVAVSPVGVSEAANYFSFSPTKTASRRPDDKGFYFYKAAPGETIRASLGYVVMSDFLEEYKDKMYFRFEGGSELNDKGQLLENDVFVKAF